MSSQHDSILDKGFEVIVTGMAMIDALVEAHQQLWGAEEPQPKFDDPATFEQSLIESSANHGDNRRRP
jgi:hypothetical protein